MSEQKEKFTIVKRLNGKLRVTTPSPHVDPRRLLEIAQWATERVVLPIGESIELEVKDASAPLYEDLCRNLPGLALGLRSASY
jgi:hypothetical protein